LFSKLQALAAVGRITRRPKDDTVRVPAETTLSQDLRAGHAFRASPSEITITSWRQTRDSPAILAARPVFADAIGSNGERYRSFNGSLQHGSA